MTGSSSGIGEAFAEVFAADGYDLVLVARRRDRLEGVAARLRQAYGRTVHVITADLSQADAPRRLCEELEARAIAIDALVNNAGYGVPGAFLKSPWQRHADFLTVMVVAVAELTYRLLPAMVARGHGRILNVASLAGLVPAPAGHTLYGASKAFVIKFSEALAHEVRGQGVLVTAVCPGFTLSEFHDVTGTRDSVSRLPTLLWMDAADVAREGYAANAGGTSIYVTGGVNRLLAWLVRTMPQGIVSAVNRRAARSYRHT
ncbi:MAG: SDR family NAD(P)-dependent oxidoreductase [Vicinamibacterales bacterium]